MVAQLQRQAERIRQQELAEALARFPAETHEDLERLTRSLVRKILHHPSTQLRGGGEAVRDTLPAAPGPRAVPPVKTTEDEG